MAAYFHIFCGQSVSLRRPGARRGAPWQGLPKLLASFLLASGLLLAQSNVVTAAADPWPPFADPSHPRQGVALEIIRAAFRTRGYSVVMHFVPWSRAEAGVTSGQYDLLIDVWLTEARTRKFLFSAPYAQNALKFIKRREDPFEYQGLDSLAGKVVGTIRGYGYGDAFQSSSGFLREDASDLLQNVRKLLAQRIDLTLEDEIVAKAILAQGDPGLLDRIAFSRTALSVNPLHLAAGRDNPRGRELVEAFNAGLLAIRNDHTYDRILASYGLK